MAKDKRDRHVQGERKMKEETPEQKQAFETYFLMGEERSYRKLAKSLNRSPSSITNWAKAFDWTERIAERDNAVNKIVEEKNNKTMAELKLETARQMDGVMTTFWEKVMKGKMEIETWSDFERIWKLRMDIGGDTERKRSNALADLTDMITKVGKEIIQERTDD